MPGIMACMIHTSLSPNAQRDDVFLALGLLLRPDRWHDGRLVRNVEQTLETLVPGMRVTTVDSGRTALATLVSALGIGPGDEVLVQGYTCVAVPGPVLWAGAVPVYVDCADDLTMDVDDLKRKITSKTKAVVVQHTFGMPARIDEILAVAKEHDLVVIEDCAHALGGTHHSKPLGTFADASFFSFGRDKCISSVFGGAIAVRSDALHAKVRALTDAYPLPSTLWITRLLWHPIILSLSKATYNSFGIGRLILGAARRLGIIARAVQPVELSGGKPTFVFHRFSPALAALALNQLEKLPRFVEHRRTCARSYAEKLAGLADVVLPPAAEGHTYLRYTLQVPEPQACRAKARAAGIELGDWYTTVLAPNGVAYAGVRYAPGSCPNAERLAARSLNLPTHIGITPEMIDTIVKYVRI
jgi:perosamine synthetase